MVMEAGLVQWKWLRLVMYPCQIRQLPKKPLVFHLKWGEAVQNVEVGMEVVARARLGQSLSRRSKVKVLGMR